MLMKQNQVDLVAGHCSCQHLTRKHHRSTQGIVRGWTCGHRVGIGPVSCELAEEKETQVSMMVWAKGPLNSKNQIERINSF